MAPPEFNEEDTFIAGRKPLNGYVKNLLDDSTLTLEQKILHLLSEVINGMDEIRKHGCSVGVTNTGRIEKLEGWRSWVIGGLAGVAAIMGFVLFILTIVKGAM